MGGGGGGGGGWRRGTPVRVRATRGRSPRRGSERGPASQTWSCRRFHVWRAGIRCRCRQLHRTPHTCAQLVGQTRHSCAPANRPLLGDLNAPCTAPDGRASPPAPPRSALTPAPPRPSRPPPPCPPPCASAPPP